MLPSFKGSLCPYRSHCSLIFANEVSDNLVNKGRYVTIFIYIRILYSVYMQSLKTYCRFVLICPISDYDNSNLSTIFPTAGFILHHTSAINSCVDHTGTVCLVCSSIRVRAFIYVCVCEQNKMSKICLKQGKCKHRSIREHPPLNQ